MIDITAYYTELKTLGFKNLDNIPPEMVYDYLLKIINSYSRTTEMIVDIHQERGSSKDEEYLKQLRGLKDAVMDVRSGISLTKQTLNAIIRTEKFKDNITTPPEEERPLEESDLAWQGNESELTEGGQDGPIKEHEEIIFDET